MPILLDDHLDAVNAALASIPFDGENTDGQSLTASPSQEFFRSDLIDFTNDETADLASRVKGMYLPGLQAWFRGVTEEVMPPDFLRYYPDRVLRLFSPDENPGGDFAGVSEPDLSPVEGFTLPYLRCRRVPYARLDRMATASPSAPVYAETGGRIVVRPNGNFYVYGVKAPSRIARTTPEGQGTELPLASCLARSLRLGTLARAYSVLAVRPGPAGELYAALAKQATELQQDDLAPFLLSHRTNPQSDTAEVATEVS